jgi:hypothetical protein
MKIVVEADGKEFAKDNLKALAWFDGLYIPLQQTRNNPPYIVQFKGDLPAELVKGSYKAKIEWYWSGDYLPDHVTEQTFEVAGQTVVKPPALPLSTIGMPHIRRDNSIGVEVKDNSEIYVGVYAFGPGEFSDARYGTVVRDELLDANIGLEAGAILHYTPQNWSSIDEYWNSSASFRQASEDFFKRWSGPWSVPEDDLFYQTDVNLVKWIQQPWFEESVKRWLDWKRTLNAQTPRFLLLKDEVNDAFGINPEGTDNRYINLLAPFGGMYRIVQALRQGGFPVSSPVMGVGKDVPVGFTAWHSPKYSDFVSQYHDPGSLPPPWSGQTLRQTAGTMSWAAKHRDINRPLSLNVSLITGNITKQPDGTWKRSNPSSSVDIIPGQLWVALALGATVIRAYYLQRFDDLPAADFPVGEPYQQSVRPGSPEYKAFLTSAKMVKEYTSVLLGVEQEIPYAGPDFMCGHRYGSKGRIYWAVNLSEAARQINLLPNFQWTSIVHLSANGTKTQLPSSWIGNPVVERNSVVVLTS